VPIAKSRPREIRLPSPFGRGGEHRHSLRRHNHRRVQAGQLHLPARLGLLQQEIQALPDEIADIIMQPPLRQPLRLPPRLLPGVQEQALLEGAHRPPRLGEPQVGLPDGAQVARQRLQRVGDLEVRQGLLVPPLLIEPHPLLVVQPEVRLGIRGSGPGREGWQEQPEDQRARHLGHRGMTQRKPSSAE
jgi:hypothetical protein